MCSFENFVDAKPSIRLERGNFGLGRLQGRRNCDKYYHAIYDQRVAYVKRAEASAWTPVRRSYLVRVASDNSLYKKLGAV